LARRRFFVDSIRNGAAELRGEEARHLTRVLRVEPGQRFEISDNSQAWLAEIAEARGERVVFRMVEPVHTPVLPVRITLCAALIKFDHFEWIIEKATELGVDAILPFEAARTEKGLLAAAAKRIERWRRIARESSQQSRRLRMPEILPAVNLAAALETRGSRRFFLDENGGAPLVRELDRAGQEDCPTWAVMTGPEGGWAEEERNRALAAGWQGVSLGPAILRAETAALAALAVISAGFTIEKA
jgi:16S rRNA (uracil1498-N3)-methyltransferase